VCLLLFDSPHLAKKAQPSPLLKQVNNDSTSLRCNFERSIQLQGAIAVSSVETLPEETCRVESNERDFSYRMVDYEKTLLPRWFAEEDDAKGAEFGIQLVFNEGFHD